MSRPARTEAAFTPVTTVASSHGSRRRALPRAVHSRLHSAATAATSRTNSIHGYAGHARNRHSTDQSTG
jgi:hypothetical protein